MQDVCQITHTGEKMETRKTKMINPIKHYHKSEHTIGRWHRAVDEIPDDPRMVLCLSANHNGLGIARCFFDKNICKHTFHIQPYKDEWFVIKHDDCKILWMDIFKNIPEHEYFNNGEQ